MAMLRKLFALLKRFLKAFWGSLSHNLGLKLLSLLFAVLLWSYVVSSNPSITRHKLISGIDAYVTNQSVLNAYGLATRLEIAPDEAQEFIDAYFAGFPQIKDYLARQVGRATGDGFTETILGRRRYIPELQASNPRVRDMGRRMALNAPIQGSAADVFKLGMLGVDRALRASTLDCHMLLTVHDELVFEVAQAHVEDASALVRREMEGAYELSVPLRADIGWGSNWAEAVPEGH
jgi:hypothetical protein